ncbi:MAG: 2Fe-2S iron-sulfur cluster binding domain-containing protein [Halothiobacillus sp.]|jgi:2Fe-2S ferredoxin|nr:2Fe-2S iron-sulfur cluster binding domain-containing protein [Halothiobacillus sp.]HUX82426.1 2Fe-2S iron-sulfur cluster binding domain-containing protein [Halothiobacillus sp.]
MSVVTILPSNKTITVEAGTLLSDAILAAGETLTLKCEGKGECDSCHVFVHEGRKSLSKTQRKENEQLDQIVGVGSKSRLACQATIGDEDVSVELLGFSSGF